MRSLLFNYDYIMWLYIMDLKLICDKPFAQKERPKNRPWQI